MKDKISPRSGILNCEQGSATFYLHDYDFRIMNNSPFKVPSLTAENSAKLIQTNKYFHGITHDGYDIAVYLGNRQIRPIQSVGIFHSSLYAVQIGNIKLSNWNKIDAIEFRGGTLNFLSSSQEVPFEFINDAVKPSPVKAPFTFPLKFDDSTILVEVGTAVTESYGKDRVEIVGRTQYLTLKFEKPISFGDIQFHIEKVKTLLSFMTFRQNVGFDEIILQEKTLPNGFLMASAEVYSREASSLTRKNEFKNICFDELGDFLPHLMNLLYNEETNNPFIFMNFIPETDKHWGKTTNDMVKNIVTCLECEIARLRGKNVELIEPDSKSETYLAEEKLLSALKKELRSTIKIFQQHNHSFSKKTSDMLYGTVNHMTLADADKIYFLYTKYQVFLRSIFNTFDFVPTREDIEHLVIYRNKTTHGTQEVLDSRIAATAHYLVGLIYCMILHSIGIDDNDLQKLCEKHFLY